MRNHSKKFVAALAITLCAALGASVPADAEDSVTQAGVRGWCC